MKKSNNDVRARRLVVFKGDNARERDYWPREGENVVHR